MDYLKSNDLAKKQEVFSWVVERLSEFRGAHDPTFRRDQMDTILILQVNEDGYQDTQISQDSMSIEHKKGHVVAVHRQPFSSEKQKLKQCEESQCSPPKVGSEEIIEESQDVVITNDDNADVSLPHYSPDEATSQKSDHSYTRRSFSLKKLPSIPASLLSVRSRSAINRNMVLKKKEEYMLQNDSAASSSGNSSQKSLFEPSDSESDASTITAEEDTYYKSSAFDIVSEDDRLDDIPHVMDPHIAQLSAAADTDSPYIGNKGIAKKSSKSATTDSASSSQSA